MNDRQKKQLIRIAAAAVLLALLAALPLSGLTRFGAYLIPYLLIGYDVLFKAARGLKNRRPLDECFLMAVATLGAMGLAACGDGDYAEGVAVMLFYQVGEWFQSYAAGRSRRDIRTLMDIRPDYANIERENGQLEQVDPRTVAPGSVVVVRPGEKIPLDGVVEKGTSSLNTVALTGESMPRDVAPGDAVASGCLNQQGVLRLRTTRDFGESAASKILRLVEEAGARKSKSERFIARFARVYTPAVVGAAFLLALLPPLIRMAGMGLTPEWGVWFYRALTFLVISCPCALVLSVPLSFFAGIGGASRRGVLIKGANYLETLAAVDTVVFDKTGTLTKGVFEVSAVHPEKLDARQLLHLAAHVERFSSHPIAASLKAAYPDEADDCRVEEVEEIAGQGIRARVNGETVCVGNSRMMERIGAAWRECSHAGTGTVIHIAVQGVYAGHIIIEDVIKEHAAEAIAGLRENGVRKLVMLTGDARPVADHVAARLGLDLAYSELLPADKVDRVEQLLADKKGSRGRLAFVGDGINDAPVLSRSDVGIAMGAMGSDAAIEAADIVLMDDDPLQIVTAQRIARRTMRIVRQNIWGSIGVKAAVLILGALGLANLWAAVFADVGVMVLAVCNAMRALLGVKKSGAESSAPDSAAMDEPQHSYRIEVDCANCAGLMEDAARRTPGIRTAAVNFMALRMNVEFEEGQEPAAVMARVRANCKKIENDCEIYF